MTRDRSPKVSADPLVDVAVLQCMDGVIQAGRLVHRYDAAKRCDRWKPAK